MMRPAELAWPAIMLIMAAPMLGDAQTGSNGSKPGGVRKVEMSHPFYWAAPDPVRGDWQGQGGYVAQVVPVMDKIFSPSGAVNRCGHNFAAWQDRGARINDANGRCGQDRGRGGRVVGIGACGGSVAMMFFGTVVGLILQITHGNYGPVFLMAGTAYLIAIGCIQLLAPQLDVVDVA